MNMKRITLIAGLALLALAGLPAGAPAHHVGMPDSYPSLGDIATWPGDAVQQVTNPGEPGVLSPGGVSSKNVEWVKRVPEPSVLGQGARLVGDYFYTSVDSQGLIVFDVSEPEDPVAVGRLPMPHAAENEDLATNGKILLLSQGGDVDYFTGEPSPVSSLYVIDVRDKTNPRLLSRLPGGGDHTVECLDRCRWAYTAGGKIIDLRNPAEPELRPETWGEGLEFKRYGAGPLTYYGHDVTEVRRGRVLTTTNPMLLLDTSDPVRPELLARSVVGEGEKANSTHLVEWPNGGTERFAFGQDESIAAAGRCETGSTAFVTWDASHWRRTGTFTLADTYSMRNGTYVDGNPAIGGPYGCSSHLFGVHPHYDDGGIVAVAYYDHGARFLKVASDGQIAESGYFVPWGGWTGAVYFITPTVAYVFDLRHGIDIVRFKG
jgi:hypothetical protein